MQLECPQVAFRREYRKGDLPLGRLSYNAYVESLSLAFYQLCPIMWSFSLYSLGSRTHSSKLEPAKDPHLFGRTAQICIFNRHIASLGQSIE